MQIAEQKYGQQEHSMAPPKAHCSITAELKDIQIYKVPMEISRV